MRLLGCHPADAEDAVSAALLSAMQQFSRISPPILNERAWLSRILYNICIDIHRYRRRFTEPATLNDQDMVEEGLDWFHQKVEQSPEEALLAREQSQELNKHIQTLPPGLRVPLVMRFYQGMSYPEIAAELKLTVCNARKRVQLAYSQLREACSETA